jgi:hypothetical protein
MLQFILFQLGALHAPNYVRMINEENGWENGPNSFKCVPEQGTKVLLSTSTKFQSFESLRIVTGV